MEDSRRAQEMCFASSTQKCLLSLVRGEVLDDGRPNVSLHRGQSYIANQGRPHRLILDEWLTLIHDQLTRTLDDGCEPLGKQGARGVLFRVTLGLYGSRSDSGHVEA